jgi:hypothetical protein
MEKSRSGTAIPRPADGRRRRWSDLRSAYSRDEELRIDDDGKLRSEEAVRRLEVENQELRTHVINLALQIQAAREAKSPKMW